MRHKVLILIIVILFTCLICLIALGALMVSRWDQPLGERVILPTPTPTLEPTVNTPTIPPTQTKDVSTPTEPTSTATIIPPTATPTPTEVTPLCGGPKLLYILAAGIDNSLTDYRYGRADVIRIVRIDFITPKVSVLTLPRDLWVELPDIKEAYEHITHGKINTAYFYGAPALDRYQGTGGGPGLLAHTIAHNYGLYTENYVVINMLAFEQIVDALGGIDIYLDQTWDGRGDRDADHHAWVFEEGQHHMSGAEALRFARIRLGYTEIIRTDNQTLVMCAVKEKMQQPRVIGAIPELVTAFLGKVQTDLTPAQISQLTCLLPKLGRDNLQFVRFPNEMFVPGRVFDPGQKRETFVWDIPIEDIREFMIDFSNDSIPMDMPGGGSNICP
jgi:LCP family protein required for cell wall assembly